MHGWTVTDTRLARDSTSQDQKDCRRAGDGGFLGFRRRLQTGALSGQTGHPSGLRACAQRRWAWRMTAADDQDGGRGWRRTTT